VGGKVEDVLGAGCPEAVDRLEVVADRRQPTPLSSQGAHDLDLESVQVLVLVDQYLVEHRAHLRSKLLVAAERMPIEEQVIQVECAKRPLALRVPAKERGQFVRVLLAPGEGLGDNFRQRLLRVDRARVDIGHGRLAREALPLGRQSELFADHVEQVSGVRGVEYCEVPREAERRSVRPQQAISDRVEGPADDPCSAGSDNVSYARQHLPRRPPREGQKQHPLRRNALVDKPRGAGRERRCFPGPGPCQNKQRPSLIRDRGDLLVVQFLEERPGSPTHRRPIEHMFHATGAGITTDPALARPNSLLALRAED
jgi:hypothetical protein